MMKHNSRRPAAASVVVGLLACVLSFALVQAGPLAPAAQAFEPGSAAATSTLVRFAPVSTLGAPAVAAGIGVAAIGCVAWADCRNFVLDWFDSRDPNDQDTWTSAVPGEAVPGNSLTWNSGPSESVGAVQTAYADANYPTWAVNWQPSYTGGPSAEMLLDVTCGTSAATAQTYKGYNPPGTLTPGSPAYMSGDPEFGIVHEICAVGWQIFELRAYITQANFCNSNCGGDILWRKNVPTGAGTEPMVATVTVTCRFSDGTEVEITSTAQTYNPNTAKDLTAPSCASATAPDGSGGTAKQVPARDTFNRANSVSMGVTSHGGDTWVSLQPGCQIVSNKASCATGSASLVSGGVKDGKWGVQVEAMSGNPGLMFRTNSAMTQGYIWYSSGALYFFNNSTTPAFFGTGYGTWAAGDLLSVTVGDDACAIFKRNGTQTKSLCGVHNTGSHTWGGLWAPAGGTTVTWDEYTYPGDAEEIVPAFPVEVTVKCGVYIGNLETCATQGVDPGQLDGVNDPYADCLASQTACRLDVFYQGVRCAVGMTACVDWMTKQGSAPADYECRWGPHVMPITDCAGLAQKYGSPTQPDTSFPKPGTEPQPTTTVTAAPAPTLSPQPQPTTSSTPDATVTGAPRPGESGAPAATDPQGQECWPSGWGVFNPLEWVYRPTVCALKWAFVPRSGTWTATIGDDGLLGAWEGSAFGEWNDATGDVIGAFAGFDDYASGCEGPSLSGDLSGQQYELKPLDACAPPMSTVAAVTKGLLTVIVGFGGAFLIIDPLFAALGLGIKPTYQQGELF